MADILDVINDIVAWAVSCPKALRDAKQKVNKYRQKVEKRELKAIDTEFGAKQLEEYKRAFTKAIDFFYEDYDPMFYERSFSLYDAWDGKTDDDGTVMGTVSLTGGIVINDSALIKGNIDGGLTGGMRSGDGADILFNQAFIEGWHGGAKTINEDSAKTWGAHPFPGVPYYRKPGWVTYPNGLKKLHRYAKWSRRAERMYGAPSGAPKGMFLAMVHNMNETTLLSKYDEIYNEHLDNYVQDCMEYQNSLLDPIINPPWVSKLL